MQQWLQAQQTKAKMKEPGSLNAKQFEVVEKVALRAAIENPNEVPTQRKGLEHDNRNSSLANPLRWVVHGGPGVGKSHVISSIATLFTDVFGWQHGVEFQNLALQAVMADQLNGDTLHHALGINPFDQYGPGNSRTDLQETARRLEHLRWIIIDEISMISAAFLASIDMQLRSIMSNIHKTKKMAAI